MIAGFSLQNNEESYKFFPGGGSRISLYCLFVIFYSLDHESRQTYWLKLLAHTQR